MRILPPVKPSAEQLPILSDSRSGFRLIRGAAGSGKTTTALLRLRQLCSSRLARHDRLGLSNPVRVLVLTYNRTLEGYIKELAKEQVPSDPRLYLEVSTFAKWARRLVGSVDVLDRDQVTSRLRRDLLAVTGRDASVDFFVDEVEYALGRYLPSNLTEYLTRERTGRGISPRVDTALRRRLLDDVIKPYQDSKSSSGVIDWNDLALAAADLASEEYDVVIVDEAQDFSANQVRAILGHLADEHSTTFVLDAVQRIYPRAFTWIEVGINLRPNMIYKLTENHRNTSEVAAFARALVEDLPVDDDGSLPDFSACRHSGVRPKVVVGTYAKQLAYMLEELGRTAEGEESTAILQPRGGGWFDYARSTLRQRGIPFCELTRESRWPTGPEQVALSTIPSAKGLEFDHVLLPGLNQQVTPHGDGEGDANLDRLRRLLAMGAGRARKSVMVGYKPGEESTLVHLLDPSTFDVVKV